MNYLENNIWFPYFSIEDGIPPIKVVSASGVRLKLENGRELVDGVSSWWAMCHGYNNPHIIKAIQKQVETLSHIMIGGVIHQALLDASSKLVNFIGGKELSRAFFSDSGSTAVEVGLKMAIQYFFELGKPNKNKIIYFEDGYHGETFGALSFSHSTHSLFPSLSNRILCKIPTTEKEFIEFESFVEKEKHSIAGSIIEPVMQGAGGIKFYKPEQIKRLWEILKKAEILVIADECATGFYRLGSRFAFWKVGFEPDILILGKALTGGHLPLAVTIAKEWIFQGICGKSRFFHGPTFMANPTCLSSLLASIELFEKNNYEGMVTKIEDIFNREFKNARIMGAVCAFDIAKEVNLEVKRDVSCGKTKSFLRPFVETLYAMPPLIISEEDLLVIIRDIKRYVS
jgi:adenosylmethionine-8-amino-7-oxononanoate aminotransferase